MQVDLPMVVRLTSLRREERAHDGRMKHVNAKHQQQTLKNLSHSHGCNLSATGCEFPIL